MRDEYSIETADNFALIAEAFRLRHQVYCIEHAYESGWNGIEHDSYDINARHVLLRRHRDRQVVGTVRVVLPGRPLPMQTVCHPSLTRPYPMQSTGEISRFALSKVRRKDSGQAGIMMRIGLMQGIVRVSQEAGLTHWCAVMERSLLRLLSSTGIYFHPLGPMVDFHGPRQPAMGRIETVLARLRREAEPIFDYVTAGGALCLDQKHRLAA